MSERLMRPLRYRGYGMMSDPIKVRSSDGMVEEEEGRLTLK